MYTLNKILPLFFAVFISGCATIFSSNIRNVGINSHPQKADILITNQLGQVVYKGKTPIILPLNSNIGSFRSATYFVAFSKDSFQQQSAILQAKFNWVSLLNVVFPPGFIVDGLTGSMYRLGTVYVLENLKYQPPVIKYDDLPKYYPSLTK